MNRRLSGFLHDGVEARHDRSLRHDLATRLRIGENTGCERIIRMPKDFTFDAVRTRGVR